MALCKKYFNIWSHILEPHILPSFTDCCVLARQIKKTKTSIVLAPHGYIIIYFMATGYRDFTIASIVSESLTELHDAVAAGSWRSTRSRENSVWSTAESRNKKQFVLLFRITTHGIVVFQVALILLPFHWQKGVMMRHAYIAIKKTNNKLWWYPQQQ